VNNRAGEGT